MSSSFGERMKAIRESLYGDKEVPDVSQAAMARVWFGDGWYKKRHRYRNLEHETDPSDRKLAEADEALVCLVGALELDDESKTLDALTSYIRGKRKTLPWSSAPKWKAGMCPTVKPGRKTGSSVVSDGDEVRVVGPDESPQQVLRSSPRHADRAVAAAVSAADAAARNPDTALTILEQVRAGALTPEAALPVLRVVIPCGHVHPVDDFEGLSTSTQSGSILSPTDTAKGSVPQRSMRRARAFRASRKNQIRCNKAFVAPEVAAGLLQNFGSYPLDVIEELKRILLTPAMPVAVSGSLRTVSKKA